MKIIDRGLAKPDDPIYKSGPVIGGVRFYNPPKGPKPEKAGNSLREAIATITPEQTEENERIMAGRRAEAVAKGQHPMQAYADANEGVLFKTIEDEIRSGRLKS